MVISSKYCLQLVAGVAPGEVGVGLGEAGLGEGVHDVGAGEGFGEEDDVGIFFVDLGDAPLPEGEGLGVGVVDAEDADVAANPVDEDIAEGLPEAAPVGGFEVEGVDVLIFLRRVFGVLDGAVGADDEPVGMLGDPGMVGRALEGDVEREFHAVSRAWRRRVRRSRAKVPSWG